MVGGRFWLMRSPPADVDVSWVGPRRVRACLNAEAPSFSLLLLHGPGGIGKSSLLDTFAAEAARVGFRAATGG